MFLIIKLKLKLILYHKEHIELETRQVWVHVKVLWHVAQYYTYLEHCFLLFPC